MIEILRQIVVAIFIVSGLFFYVVGTVGLIRMPDVFSRTHATTKADTLGAGLVMVGLVIWQGISFASLNIIIVLVFIWLTMPTAAHAIVKSEYENQQKGRS